MFGSIRPLGGQTAAAGLAAPADLVGPTCLLFGMLSVQIVRCTDDVLKRYSGLSIWRLWLRVDELLAFGEVCHRRAGGLGCSLYGRFLRGVIRSFHLGPVAPGPPANELLVSDGLFLPHAGVLGRSTHG